MKKSLLFIAIYLTAIVLTGCSREWKSLDLLFDSNYVETKEKIAEETSIETEFVEHDEQIQEPDNNAEIDYRSIYYDFLLDISADRRAEGDTLFMQYSLINVQDSDMPYLLVGKYDHPVSVELYDIDDELNVEKIYSTEGVSSYGASIALNDTGILYVLTSYGMSGYSVTASEFCINKDCLGVENKKSDHEFVYNMASNGWSEELQDRLLEFHYLIDSEEVTPKELYKALYKEAQGCVYVNTYEVTEENIDLITDKQTVFSENYDIIGEYFRMFDNKDEMEIYYNDSELLDIVLIPDEIEIGLNDSGELVNWELNLYFSEEFKDLESLDYVIMSWDDEPISMNLSTNHDMFEDFGWSAALQGKTRYVVFSDSNTGEYNLSIGLPDNSTIAGEQHIIICNTIIKFTLTYLGDYHSGLGWKISDISVSHTEAEDNVVNPETEDDSVYTEYVEGWIIDYKTIYAAYLNTLLEKGETEDVSFSLVNFEGVEIPYLVLESTFYKDYTTSGYSYNDYYTIEDGAVVRKFTTAGSRYLLYDSEKNTFFTPINTMYGTSGYKDALYGYRLDDISKFAERPEFDSFAISLESSIHDYFVRYEYRVDSYYEETEVYSKTYYDYYKIDEDDTVSAGTFFGRMYEDMSDCTRAVFYEISEENISGVFEGDFEVTANAYEVLEDFWSEKTDFHAYFCK